MEDDFFPEERLEQPANAANSDTESVSVILTNLCVQRELPDEEIASILYVTSKTVQGWRTGSKTPGKGNTERIRNLAKISNQTLTVLSNFKFSDFIRTEEPLLGGLAPQDLLEDIGVGVVFNHINSGLSGDTT